MLLVFFATDQSHRTPRAAEIQPMSREAAAVTRLYRGLVLDTHAPLVARGCVPQTRQWDYADNRKHQTTESKQLSCSTTVAVFFFLDNVNLKYVTFWISQGKVATSDS